MKKTLAISLSVCLAVIFAYCGAGYWVGGRVRQQHDRLITQINRLNYLEASTGSYQRGIFKSSALTAFTLTRPGNAGSINFNLISSIYHGPFVFLKNPHLKGGLHPVLAVIRMKLAPARDSAETLKKVLETIPELEASEALTVFFVDGGGESYLDVPSFQKKFHDEKGEEFEAQWGGFTAKSRFDVRFGEVVGSWSSPSLQVTGQNQFIMRMKNFEGDYNSHSGIKGINVGSAAISIGSVGVSEKDKSPFNLTSLRIKTESGVSGETIDGALHLGFDSLNADGMALGPFAMEFEARKLDAEVLSRLLKLVGDLRNKPASAERSEPANREMEKSAEAVMLDLLTKSPEFEIKQLRLRTDKGDLSGRAKIAFAGPMENQARNILLLIASIDAGAELSVSEPLGYFIAENLLRNAGQGEESTKMKADAIIKDLVAAKYITSEGGSFKSSAAYRHGALAVNGRKLDLSSLKHIGR